MKYILAIVPMLVFAVSTLFLPLVGAQTSFSPSQPVGTEPKLSILLPLYQDPSTEGNSWATVAQSAKRVPITVIINPNNGPDRSGPSNEYRVGIATLRSGGATVVGYVPTNYGKRPIADVQQDIDAYALRYNLDGIFIDETAQEAAHVMYYQAVVAYIHTTFAGNHVILNPGLVPDAAYVSTIDRAVFTIFEGDQRAWTQLALPEFIAQQPSNRLAALVYDVPTGAQASTIVDQAVQRRIGLIYVTSRALSDDPWNGIPTYWDALVDAVERVNQPSAGVSAL